MESPDSGPLIGTTLTRARGAASSTTAYLEAVAAGGGIPIAIPYGLDSASLRRLFEQLDGILLSGGGDIDPDRYGGAASPLLRGVDAERDHLELRLARWAVEDGKPILGICRGLQIMNVAFGGTLFQDIATEVPGALPHDHPDTPGDSLVHSVTIEPGSLFKAHGLGARIETNSSHHQAVRDLGRGLRGSGKSQDGVIEALEIPGHPFAIAVQWHPERLLGRPEARALLQRFAHASAGE